jgi:hypothetical protein
MPFASPGSSMDVKPDTTVRTAAEIIQDLNAFGRLDEANVERFDALLAEACESRDEALIPVLLRLLDDDGDFHEVVFGVVHAVESFPDEPYFHALAINLADLQAQGRAWCERLHTRILNSPSHFDRFLASFESLQPAVREQEIEMLRRIAADPDFALRCRNGIERLRAMPPSTSER